MQWNIQRNATQCRTEFLRSAYAVMATSSRREQNEAQDISAADAAMTAR